MNATAAGTPTNKSQPAQNTSRIRVLVLQPGKTERNYWADLWAYRELFWVLAWRDLSVRYKQTAIGIAWALIRPLLTLLVFSAVFGGLAKLPSEGNAPYFLLVFAGMLPWTLYSTILSEASNSLVSNASLIGKVYFPRLIIPSATIVVALADFGVTLVLLLLAMLITGSPFTARLALLPFLILLAVFAALGPALLMAALNVKYRDFRYVIPFLLQFGLYISPVGFSSSVVPERWRFVYNLNPVVGLVDGFRWCVLGSDTDFQAMGIAANLLVVAGLLGVGLSYFRKTERGFADFI